MTKKEKKTTYTRRKTPKQTIKFPMRKGEPLLVWGVYSIYAGRMATVSGPPPPAAQLGAHHPSTLVLHHNCWWRQGSTQGPVLAEWCQLLPPPPPPESLHFRRCPDPALVTSTAANKQPPSTLQMRAYTWHNKSLTKTPPAVPPGSQGMMSPRQCPCWDGFCPSWGTGPPGVC